MKRFINHTRSLILRGLLATIPLTLSLLALQFIYVMIDKRVTNLVERFVGFRIPGLGILFILVVLYLIGVMVSNVLGKSFFNVVEMIFNRIPILRTTYQIGKQLSSTFSLSEKQKFKKAVLVNCKTGIWTIGFITGIINDKSTNEKLYKVFIPTVPNPTTGFVFIVKESETIDPKWTVDEAMRTVITAGIISPETINP